MYEEAAKLRDDEKKIRGQTRNCKKHEWEVQHQAQCAKPLSMMNSNK